jgi:hypothetical protein
MSTPPPFTELQEIQEAQREGCVPEPASTREEWMQFEPAVATPRTDGAARKGAYLTAGNYPETCGKQIVHIEFARQLEREIAELNQRLIDRQESNQSQLIRIEDGWREKLRESQAQPASPGKLTNAELGEIGRKCAYGVTMRETGAQLVSMLVGNTSDLPARTAFARAVREAVEKEQGEEIARLTVRDAGKLSEITSLHHLLDEAGVELAEAEAEIERYTTGYGALIVEHSKLQAKLATAEKRLGGLEWRPVSVKPTQEDADGDGLMIQVLFTNGYTQQQLFDSAFSSGATHWRACCPPPAPTAEEVSRAEFEDTFPNMPKERTPSGMYAKDKFQAMWESWQAARAAKEMEK